MRRIQIFVLLVTLAFAKAELSAAASSESPAAAPELVSEIFQIQYAYAPEVADVLDKLGSGNTFQVINYGNQRLNDHLDGAIPDCEILEPGLRRIMADERSNSLLIVAPSSYISKVKR